MIQGHHSFEALDNIIFSILSFSTTNTTITSAQSLIRNPVVSLFLLSGTQNYTTTQPRTRSAARLDIGATSSPAISTPHVHHSYPLQQTAFHSVCRLSRRSPQSFTPKTSCDSPTFERTGVTGKIFTIYHIHSSSVTVQQTTHTVVTTFRRISILIFLDSKPTSHFLFASILLFVSSSGTTQIFD